MSWIRIPTTAKNTCPGIRDLVRPTLRYGKCHLCDGYVEIWSDEDNVVCIDCGAKWTIPDDEASCLDYCEYAEECKRIIANRKQ